MSLVIDFERGRIYRLVKSHNTYKIAGWKRPDGYVHFRLNGKPTLAHRYIYEQFHQVKLTREQEVNHINHKRDDNRIENLEVVTNQQNGQWVRKYKNNTSGYKGVSWYKRDEKWQAQIGVDGKVIHLGLFDDKEAAHQVYVNKATELNQKGHKFHI